MTTSPATAREPGLTMIESVIVLSLLTIILLAVTGLHVLAISAGNAAEASTIATNLARARLEELHGLPPSQLIQQNDTEVVEQVAAGRGRTYTVRTIVEAPDPARLDITVKVTWQQGYGSACASGERGATCTPGTVTYTRTLQTRIYTPDYLPGNS